MIRVGINTPDFEKYVHEIKDACIAAVGTAAESISVHAALLAPVKTGKLRDSIKIEKKNDYISVGSDLPYAFFVEYGTNRAKPSPFLQPAAFSGAETLRESLRNGLK